MSATIPPQMSVCSPPPPPPSLSRSSHPLKQTMNMLVPRSRTTMPISKGAISPLERISLNTTNHNLPISNLNTRDNIKTSTRHKTSRRRNRHINSGKLATVRMTRPRTSLASSPTRISEHLHDNPAPLVDNPRRAQGFTQIARRPRASKTVTNRAT